MAAMSVGKGALLFVPVTLVCEWTGGGPINEPLNLTVERSTFPRRRAALARLPAHPQGF